MNDSKKIVYFLIFVLALIINFAGINLDFFSDDQGLYASIAKNLLHKKEFFQLFTYNQDWLDKPHFPFWMILVSFKLFGVSTWAYRLPAMLFFCLSLLYTYLLASKYYGREIAAIAVLILMTALHVMLSNTDIRAEPYLMALITGSIYHISQLENRFTIADLFLAALLTACALMTKGLFVIIAIYGSLVGQLIFQKRFKELFKLKWLMLGLLTVVFTLPELYSLYLQFDLHPEKTVFGVHNVSGIKWFLWDSQFGRFVNNGPISRKASGSVFFFVHTLLWAFGPWCLIFYYVLFKNIKDIFKGKKLAEYYSLCGGGLLLLLFSLSRFQLPFYTNAVFPLFAIITAPFCYNQISRSEAKFRLAAQWIYIVLLTIIVIVLNFLLRPAHDIFFGADCILLGIFVIFIPINFKEAYKKTFFFSIASALFVCFYLNAIIYRVIIPYKGEITAAEYANLKPLSNFPVYSLKAGNNIFQFYCNKSVDLIPLDQFNKFTPKEASLFYADQQSVNYLTQIHTPFRIVRSFIDYPQENILPAFINKSTRYKVLDHVYLITK
ncbi:4-amino-4-deoxy-L-arabinose transferase-like glycosyltransferase [Mucilaginibacter frigoritolerans]|uniref:4-amino-4-deoxy-L-arabinose transferase-like glycosyltransferase n=1 Tax=Mucilaginibacter frigoritolerans TaxID=652788 RepID=A0A562U8L6_9SPHI|nr:glycosyltransferase family 39 protein [Mucilaginibacter frigoritolerans]TWJ01531.1 4-amino-4-deoxy-L-arabinose transferase-like glycosyltransferase [Mucilaginibacter frigoritolerans]